MIDSVRVIILVLAQASLAQSPSVEHGQGGVSPQSLIRDCQEFERRALKSADVDGVQLLFVRPPIAAATLEQLVTSLDLPPQEQLQCFEAARTYWRQTMAVHTGPMAALRARVAGLSLALSVDDGDSIEERCGPIRAELVRLNRDLKSHESGLIAALVAQSPSRGARATAVLAYQQEVRLSQSVPSALGGSLVDVAAFLRSCVHSCGATDSSAAQSCDEVLIESLSKGIALQRARVESVKDAHCDIARAQSSARHGASDRLDAWAACQQAGQREHRANLSLLEWNSGVVAAFADRAASPCGALIRARWAELIFPTIYPDPTSLDEFQAALCQIADASIDREAVRVVLANAELQRRAICAQMELQARAWSAKRSAELGASDEWQQHCDAFAALGLQRWTCASDALSRLKALIEQDDQGRQEQGQSPSRARWLAPSLALITQREAELFESAIIRPDPDYPLTLQLSRAKKP